MAAASQAESQAIIEAAAAKLAGKARESGETPQLGGTLKRDPGQQRFIVRQTAIKCATDLVASGRVDIEMLFRYAGRITAWIYSTKEDPTGKGGEAVQHSGD